MTKHIPHDLIRLGLKGAVKDRVYAAYARAAARQAAGTDHGHCPRCTRTLPHTQFHKDRSRPSGYACYCKDCARQDYQARKERKRNPPPPIVPDTRALDAAIAWLGVEVETAESPEAPKPPGKKRGRKPKPNAASRMAAEASRKAADELRALEWSQHTIREAWLPATLWGLCTRAAFRAGFWGPSASRKFNTEFARRRDAIMAEDTLRRGPMLRELEVWLEGYPGPLEVDPKRPLAVQIEERRQMAYSLGLADPILAEKSQSLL